MNSEDYSDGQRALFNRLKKNDKHLAKWRRRQHIHCYRHYDADIPEYALAIDVYFGIGQSQPWVHVQEYQAPKNIDAQKARQRLDEAMQVIGDFFAIDDEYLFLKVRRQQKGSAQYEKLDARQVFHEVEESGHRFLVNFTDYLDTGLFLDHRLTRQRLMHMAGDQRFLNLFAYTGTASVYAASGGARKTTTVDMSNTYLQWAQRNMRLNGFDNKAHEFVRADCLAWLKEQEGRRQYDLIFLDPPSFSASKRMSKTFDVQRDHVELLRATLKLLHPEGTLIFSNNLRSFKLDEAAFPAYQIKNISRDTLPRDFERNPRIHQCWQISRPGVGSS